MYAAMSSEHPKEALKRLVQDTKAKASEVVRISGLKIQESQKVWDLSDAVEKVLEHELPPGYDYERVSGEWQRMRDQQDKDLAGLKPYDHPHGSMGKGSAGFVVADLASPETSSY